MTFKLYIYIYAYHYVYYLIVIHHDNALCVFQTQLGCFEELCICIGSGNI